MITKDINGKLVDFYEDGDFNEDGTDYAYNSNEDMKGTVIGLEKFDMYDLIVKLTGVVKPVGDSAIDYEIKENLQDYCDLHTMMLAAIIDVAVSDLRHLASVKESSDIAREHLIFIRDEIDRTLEMCSEND